ncbi:hypothetical protein D3C86_1436820 [compost metagenome]
MTWPLVTRSPSATVSSMMRPLVLGITLTWLLAMMVPLTTRSSATALGLTTVVETGIGAASGCSAFASGLAPRWQPAVTATSSGIISLVSC